MNLTTCRPEGWSLGPSEAAARIGVHPMTLRRWADAGLVPCWRTPNGARRFRPVDIADLIPPATVQA